MIGIQLFTNSKQPSPEYSVTSTSEYTIPPSEIVNVIRIDRVEDSSQEYDANYQKHDQKYLVSNAAQSWCVSAGCKSRNESVLGDYKYGLNSRLKRRTPVYRNLCIVSVFAAFGFGLLLGVLLPLVNEGHDIKMNNSLNSTDEVRMFSSVVDAYTHSTVKDLKPKRVSLSRKTVFLTVPNKSGDKQKVQIRRNHNKPDTFSTVSFVDNKALKLLEDSHGKSAFADDEESIGPESIENMKRILNVDNFELVKSDQYKRPEGHKRKLNDNKIVDNNIFWGPEIEKYIPQGYGSDSNEFWNNYVNHGVASKMESGCGRMQNRLVTFEDGSQACVRYRQNTDQIQGELFSFYLANLLNLTNLAPSTASVVDVKNKLWKNLASDITAAQWNMNRPVVMTKYIPSLDPAYIPDAFKPMDRHLNKYDIYSLIRNDFGKGNGKKSKLLKKLTSASISNIHVSDEKKSNEEDFVNIVEKLTDSSLEKLVELAQWSDLIIFDYLTANLDRVVNNLYNFQWNVNIMDAPAHNLAKRLDNNLLLFLDNESGMLHGYRLLKKYEVYHNMLLENLCIFRRSTIDSIIFYQENDKNIGNVLNEMLVKGNSAEVLDVLPPLPEKNIKTLQDRLSKVANQVKKCEALFSTS